MARPLRIEYDGALYHVTSRGNARKSIFAGDEDRKIFLDTLDKVNDKYNFLCHAYCLMDNHYHLLIETPDGNLSNGMRQLNGVYTQRYNRRNKKVGHVFQGRYKAILLQKELHFLEVCRYIVLNPVRARAVNLPKEWKWTSYKATGGLGKPHNCLTTDCVLEQFGEKRRDAEKEYRGFVRSGIGEKTIWKKLKGQSILGDIDFVDRLIGYVKESKDIIEIPRNQRYVDRPSLIELFGKKLKRDRRITEAVYEYGYSQREVADHLGIHYSTVSRLLNKRDISRIKP
ncbi:MAG: addiction module toxin RelE [Candidatus Scalindua sp.]|nr:addiction module toxin RelE [Candidatus Scalindua sp.]